MQEIQFAAQALILMHDSVEKKYMACTSGS